MGSPQPRVSEPSEPSDDCRAEAADQEAEAWAWAVGFVLHG